MIHKEVTQMIKKNGSTVKIRIGDQSDTIVTKAIIQPLRLNDNKNIFGGYLDIGADNDNHYLYIGESNIRLDKFPPNTFIESNEDKYVVKSAERIVFKDDIFCIRAILHKCTLQNID